MMPKLSTVISVIATAMALVQGATSNDSGDREAIYCETSGGSPNMDDCNTALHQIPNNCNQHNDAGSFCTTIVTYGTCKIDACGTYRAHLRDNINCGGYLQSVLNSCHSGGLVGGRIYPKTVDVAYHRDLIPDQTDEYYRYHLQFSKHGK